MKFPIALLDVSRSLAVAFCSLLVSSAPESSAVTSQSAYLKGSFSSELHQFGHAVAVSGETIVIGAPSFGGEDTGAAYVFVRIGTNWFEQACLKPTDFSIHAFGRAVAISTNTIVIGARVAAPPGDPAPWVDGAAIVFVRDGTNWNQQAVLQPTNLQNNFGVAVSVSGEIAVVGAERDSMNGFDSGAAYVFARSGTSWTEQGFLSASNADPGDRFGASVSVSGETIVVGAHAEDSGATGVDGAQTDTVGFGDSGAAYVFIRSGTNWIQQAYLKASNTAIGDNFGFAVAVSGDSLVVGAQNEASNAIGVQNTSRRSTGQDDNHAPEAGAAYVFVRTGTNWRQQAYLKASNTGSGDRFGSSVAMSGDTVVVGAYGEDSSSPGANGNLGDNTAFNSGAAYVFSRSGTNWSSGAYLKASNPGDGGSQFAEGDYFGHAVAVSGETIVAGAPLEDSSATSVNGDQNNNDANDSGAAYVFTTSNVGFGPTVPEYNLIAFAGTGEAGFSGDVGPATNARLRSPQGVAADASGNIYLADRDNNRVRRVSTNGIIVTFAGTGTAGFTGDGGQATLAQLRSPQDLAVDATGAVYIADWGNNRIRRVDADGIITTFAGDGVRGVGGDGGQATNAQLSSSFGDLFVAADGMGKVYIADSGNLRIRRVETNGIITTFAGTGVAGFSGDGGPATNAQFAGPLSFGTVPLAVDRSGNVYMADVGNYRVRRVGTNGIITTFAGTGVLGYRGDGGAATNAQLGEIDGVAVDSAGNVFISAGVRLRRVDTDGVIAFVAGDLGRIRLAVDASGNVFGSSYERNRVYRLTPTGRMLPVVPHYLSTPLVETTLDFGKIDPEGDDDASITLIVENSGNADLEVHSIDFGSTPPGGVSISIPDFPRATFPYVLSRGSSLRVPLKWNGQDAPLDALLRIRSNDPASPATYRVLGTAIAAFAEPAEFAVLGFLSGAESQSRERGRGSIVLTGPRTTTLTLDPNSAQSLMAEIPPHLGGGSVLLSNFTGSVTITLLPTADETNQCFIRVEGGSFTAPSVRLASGLLTGLNKLTFGLPEQSGGILDLTNGNYTAFATAMIFNDLIPDGVVVRGNYSGVYNAETGQVGLESTSQDVFEASPRVVLSRTATGLRLTWANTNMIEEATHILGPWRGISNAASPYPITPAKEQQFFRVRPSTP